MSPDTLVVLTQGTKSGPDFLPLWTALAGGAIGIVGPWLTARSAVKMAQAQLHATNVVATRIRWADELRNELAELSTACLGACADLADGKKGSEVMKTLDSINLNTMRVELLLDTTSAVGLELDRELKALAEVVNAIIHGKIGDDEMDKLDEQVKRVISAGRKVINAEWSAARSSL